MKILQIISNLTAGGAETMVAELSNELNRRGIKCDILTLYDASGSKLFKKLSRENINIFSLNKAKGFQISILIRVIKFISSNNYDVVHAHIGAIKYIFLASILCRKVKFFATIHSEAKREAGTSIDKYSRKFMFKHRLCTPIAISEESEKSFEDFYGIPAKIIYNGVSKFKNTLKRDGNSQIFVHPASCQPIKNQELLIEAFKRLSKDFPNAKLIWVGRVNHYPELFSSLERTFDNNIEYWGEIDNVRDLLMKADAMCLSSKMEGLPMTIIEAFSVGCIPITTPVGGCKNIIRNGYNGFLSRDLSVDSYYKTLKHFCELSTDEISNIRENAIRSFEAFSIEECCQKYLDIYRSNSHFA